jgi:hypothetical protein
MMISKFDRRDATQDDVCDEVDVAILRLLTRERDPLVGLRVLDISCHTSRWERYLERLLCASFVEVLHPSLCDVIEEERGPLFEFPDKAFDLILWRSGAVDTDSIPALLWKCSEHLTESGRMMLVSSNPSTARERLARFTGKERDFESVSDIRWNDTPLDKMLGFVDASGVRVTNLEYSPISLVELAMLPLAALIWVGQSFCFWRRKSNYERKRLNAMFPFRSLLSRHYVLVCERSLLRRVA